MKNALIFWGGWDGHEPEKVAERFRLLLEGEGFAVEVVHGPQNIPVERLSQFDLLIPMITMCPMEGAVSAAIRQAVADGAGLAGCHGGMCDACREDTEWQFMCGGQWVSHPGNDGVRYTVNIVRGANAITAGIEDFEVTSEHYYMHVDPAVEVLATTRFPLVEGCHAANRPVDMPVAWTKYWGKGRVFYCSLGHIDNVFDNSPSAQELILKGMLWATRTL